MRYEWKGTEGSNDWGCRAWAIEKATSERLNGTWITIEMAKKAGWWSKKDRQGNETSKWQHFPEQMLMYRAAAFFIRAYAPEIANGMHTAEEVADFTVTDVTPPTIDDDVIDFDPDTGELLKPVRPASTLDAECEDAEVAE